MKLEKILCFNWMFQLDKLDSHRWNPKSTTKLYDNLCCEWNHVKGKVKGDVWPFRCWTLITRHIQLNLTCNRTWSKIVEESSELWNRSIFKCFDCLYSIHTSYRLSVSPVSSPVEFHKKWFSYRTRRWSIVVFYS